MVFPGFSNINTLIKSQLIFLKLQNITLNAIVIINVFTSIS